MAEEENILVFGASTVFGACDAENRGWVGRLGNFVEKKTDWYTLVYNLGVSGDTTNDLLERFSFECTKSRKPKIIIISAGSNDSPHINEPGNFHVPPEKFMENLRKMFDIAKARATKVMFIGLLPIDEKKTTPIPWRKDMSYTNEGIRKYDKLAREVCEEKGVPFLDMSGTFKEASEEFFYDGLHPNAAGHEKIFQAVKQFLEEKEWI